MLKPGTRIELHGRPAVPSFGFPGVAPERATIVKPRKVNLPMRPGYHLVQFADGGKLCVHESGFRVVDNRP